MAQFNKCDISKSTKRRRILLDKETVDFFSDSHINSQLQLQPSTSQDINADLSKEVLKLPKDGVDDNILCSNNTSSNTQFSPINHSIDDDYSDIENISLSSYSDDDLDDHYYNSTTCIINNLDGKNEVLKILAQWAIAQNITLTAFSALLKLLKNHSCFSDIPVDARTVLKINNVYQPNAIQVVSPGLYYHFGVANGLINSLGDFIGKFGDVIHINIGIDGLPLTKSSSSCFWPILGYARYPNLKHVFLIGLYWGKDKPHNSNTFLKEMVSELKELYTHGVQTVFRKKTVVVDAFCCDCPAKSYVLSIKGHAGYSSCTRCQVEGERVNNTTCFLGTNFLKRTHIDFINRSDDDHHVTDTISILTEVPEIDMVNDFSLDYMHLVCLGVMKKMLLLWLGVFKKSSVLVRLPNKNVNKITNHLLSMNPFIPTDFSRKSRALNEVSRWKATEFRLFLLYTGPIVLKNVLGYDCYFNFLCLHISFRILLSPNSSEKLVNFSQKLLEHFVEKFDELYGAQYVSHNVHGLLHITDDYRKFKSLEECSCFPFENFMKVLKKMLRKHEKPLEQIIKRYHESLIFNKPDIKDKSKNEIIYNKKHNNGPLFENLTSPQFQIVLKNEIKINIKSMSDNYIGFQVDKKLMIFKVFNICHNPLNNKSVFLARRFELVEQYFDVPIDSLKLGIAIVKNLSKSYFTVDIESTHFIKYIIFFDYENNINVSYPILHSSDEI